MSNEEDKVVNFRLKYFDENDSLQTVANYSRLSADYDGDLQKVGSKASFNTASAAWELVKSAPHPPRVLDVACGTGRVGACLKETFGFQGAIDGVDGSGTMLEIARSKEVYTDLREEIITHEREGSFVKHNHYDVVVCCGGFCVGHLDPRSLRDLIRSVKGGGHVVLAIGRKDEECEYGARLMGEIAELEASRLCSLIWSRKCGEIDGKTEAVLYCLRKALS